MFYPPARASAPAPAPLANMASTVVVKFDLGALPSSEKKTRRTSHQVQLERENKKKLALVNDLATLRATTLLSEEAKRDRSQSQSSDQPSCRWEKSSLWTPSKTISVFVQTISTKNLSLARGSQSNMSRGQKQTMRNFKLCGLSPQICLADRFFLYTKKKDAAWVCGEMSVQRRGQHSMRNPILPCLHL